MDVDAIRARARGEDLDGKRRYLRYDLLALCDEVENLRDEATLNDRYMGQLGADLAIAEHEIERLRAEVAERDITVAKVWDVVAHGGDDPDCDRVDYMAVPCGDVQRALRYIASPEDIRRALGVES